MDQGFSQFDAERIIDALRVGVVPPCHLSELSVGRRQWLESVRHDLQFVAGGASKVRLLSAPWGGGKTHFLAIVNEDALRLNFVVSYVELHSREAPLDRFEVVFPKLIRGLVFPGAATLESALDSWASQFPYYSAEEIGIELQNLSPSLDFRAALRSCLEHAKGDLAAHRVILRDVAGWLGGDRVSPELRRFGVYNPVGITNVTEIVGAFLRFIVHQGYGGLLVILDEAEAVTSLAQSTRRNEANQNIRKLLDNADEHVGLYVIFATTPTFLTDHSRGARSYPALWSRIRNVVSAGLEKASRRSIIIPLEPLDFGELEELATKGINIHSMAYEWDADKYIDDSTIRLYSTKFLQESRDKTVRSFIRGLVYLLDHMEEARDSSVFNSLVAQISFEDREDAQT